MAAFLLGATCGIALIVLAFVSLRTLEKDIVECLDDNERDSP